LVAARKARELENSQPADPSVARKENLTKQLQTMREMQENKQTPQARMLCQDIVDLYPRDAYPDVQGLVQQARDALPGLMPGAGRAGRWRHALPPSPPRFPTTQRTLPCNQPAPAVVKPSSGPAG